MDLFYNGNLFGHAVLKRDFIVLDLDNTYDKTSAALFHTLTLILNLLWHARLGHVGQDRMGRLAKKGLLDRLTRVKLPRYKPCLANKATIKLFSKAIRASSSLELIHSYGPMNVKARHRATYFITLIDDYSRYGYVYLLSHRYEALDVFKSFVR